MCMQVLLLLPLYQRYNSQVVSGSLHSANFKLGAEEDTKHTNSGACGVVRYLKLCFPIEGIEGRFLAASDMLRVYPQPGFQASFLVVVCTAAIGHRRAAR